MNPWIGVDPGTHWTGIVGVSGKHVICRELVEIGDNLTIGLAAIEDAIGRCHTNLPDARVAIEDTNAPSPHIGIARPADLITLGVVIGYLRRAYPDAILIPPNKHGSRPWRTYPDILLTPRERTNAKTKPGATAGQSSLMRHARSAYDVALAAPAIARLQAAAARRTA